MPRWIVGLLALVLLLSAATPTSFAQQATCLDEAELAMITAINEYRALNDLPALEPSLEFTQAADYHAASMIENKDFGHYLSTEQRSWWEVAESFGATSVYRGENIAWGNEDATATLEWWLWQGQNMYSAHLLDPNFTVIGVARVEGTAPVVGDDRETVTWAVTFGDTLTTSIAGCASPGTDPVASPTPEATATPIAEPAPTAEAEEETTPPASAVTWCTQFEIDGVETRQCGELSAENNYQFVTVVDGSVVTVTLQADNTLVVNVARSDDE